MNDKSNGTYSKKDLNRKATIAGAFYILMQLLVRGVSFIATPIYTRLVSKAQYGELRTYESWLLILVPVLSLSMYRSVSRAKYDYKEEFEEYVSSTLSLSYFVIAGFYLIVTLFLRKTVTSFLEIDGIMYMFMILYTFSYTAVMYFQTREAHLLRYKRSVLLSSMMMIPATILSILLLYYGNAKGMQDGLVDLRVIGYYTPQVIGGLLAAFIMWKDGGFSISAKYWKYAVLFSLPLIPETLSIQIMNQSDKIMIRKMIGSEVTGVFSLATTVSFIIWIIEDALWHSFMPWLFEKLERNETEEIQKPWDFITYLFGYISWALVILGPELVLILGGSKYKEAVYLIAPMVTGTLFRFFSNCFTSIERYQKKTIYCALGTVCAMLINLSLNYLCIRRFGYQSAAYTTAFSFFALLVIQGYLEKLVCGTRCVSFKKMILVSLLFWVLNELTIALYSSSIFVRYIIFAAVSSLVAWRFYPDAMKLLKLLKK